MVVHDGADIHLQIKKGPMMEQVEAPWRKLQPVERSTCRSSFSGVNCELLGFALVLDFLLEKGPHAEAEECEEQETEEATCDDLSTTPIPYLPEQLKGEEVEESRLNSD